MIDGELAEARQLLGVGAAGGAGRDVTIERGGLALAEPTVVPRLDEAHRYAGLDAHWIPRFASVRRRSSRVQTGL